MHCVFLFNSLEFTNFARYSFNYIYVYIIGIFAKGIHSMANGHSRFNNKHSNISKKKPRKRD